MPVDYVDLIVQLVKDGAEKDIATTVALNDMKNQVDSLEEKVDKILLTMENKAVATNRLKLFGDWILNLLKTQGIVMLFIIAWLAQTCNVDIPQ